MIVSLAKEVRSLYFSVKREREETKLHISSLENMVDHIADAVSNLELKVYGKLPSQTVVNP